MKPPPRKRRKTSRELPPVPEPRGRGRAVCVWPQAERRRLLSALTKLRPAGDTLDPERVREYLPTRTAEEINSVLEALKEKIILFAKTKHYTERREERRTSKPLETWLQQASAVTGDVEDSISSAFTQMLTVTSVEPHTLSDGSSSASASSQSPSVTTAPPSQTPPVKEELQNTSLPPPTAAQRPLVPSTNPQPSVRRPALPPDPMTQVSFEKIYHYLSALHKPQELCRLTPMESAVVLDLLMSLPEELLLLDCDELSQHLSQMYANLSGLDSRKTKDSSQRGKRQHPSVAPGQHQHPAPQDGSTQRKLHPPLNPFLIPLSLLSRKVQMNPTLTTGTF